MPPVQKLFIFLLSSLVLSGSAWVARSQTNLSQLTIINQTQHLISPTPVIENTPTQRPTLTTVQKKFITPTKTIRPTDTIHQPTISTTITTITAVGYYPISDSSNFKWILNVPKSGGPVSGSMEGACAGPITGYFNTPDSNGEGKISGGLTGSCQLVPSLPIQTDVKSSFEGIVYLKTGKIQLNYNTSTPISQTGQIELNFDPQ
jgi:hypothetical protein